MIGNAQILNARVHGKTPAHVWVHVLDTQPDYWTAQDARECIANGFRAQILVLPTESVSGLDLAILKGLVVHVQGENHERCMAVLNRCKQYADRVLYAPSHGSFIDTRVENAVA